MSAPRLWGNDNGSLACDKHGGAYLASAIEARPRAKKHRTPLGTWELIEGADLEALTADFRDAHLPDPGCETCPTPTPEGDRS